MSKSSVRIGIFSDVHGYLEELQQTLALLKRLGVDEMICAGDLVEKGDQSDAVVALMQAENIPCVQGNHDAKAQFTWMSHLDPLQDGTEEYLKGLPQELTFEWAGVSVYLSHCNPWQDTSIYVYPTRHIALFEQIIAAVPAQVIILGHTHMPMRVWVQDRLIINSGAIYGNTDSDSVYGKKTTDQRTCGILTLPERQFELYDILTGATLDF